MGKTASLANKEIVLGLTEKVEDAITKIVKHHQNRAIDVGKGSKIAIEIVLAPVDQQRTKFDYKIKDKVTLAEPPTEDHAGRLYFKFDADGDIEESFDRDPRQMRMEDLEPPKVRG